MEKIIKNEAQVMLNSEFTEGFRGVRRAYIVRSKQGIDVYGNTFLTFYFKTADGTVVVGRKFKVDIEDIASTIHTLNKSIVDVEFLVQIYNGSFNLIVENIKGCTGVDPTQFFDNYGNADKVYQLLNTKALALGGQSLNPSIISSSLFNVDYGKVGGYLELMGTTYNILVARNSEHLNDILRCFVGVIQPYFNYLVHLEKTDFLPRKTVLGLVNSVNIGDDISDSVVQDVLLGLMLEEVPQHFHARFIFNAIQNAQEIIRLDRMMTSAPANIVIQDKDSTLIFY